MPHTEIFYHGSCHLFNKFSLTFLGSGEGKSKFGHGIYITSNYKTAALYAAKAAKAEIVNEYRREFIAEGQMFFTYKRLGSSTMLWNNTQIKEENYIVPVPASEKH